MSNQTTDYQFYTPIVGASLDNWGTLLNANWTKTDDLLSGNQAVNGIDIESGSIDNAPIGAATPATGAFTTLACTTISATTSATLEKIICNNVTIDGNNIGLTTDDEDLMALANGALTVNGTLDTTGNITVTGDIITNGTGLVDGVDVADLNSKLSSGTYTDARLKNIFNIVYPLGAIYISADSTDPATIYGGTWAAFGEGRVLIGVGSSIVDADSNTMTFTAGTTAGHYKKVIETAQVPDHAHFVVGDADADNATRDYIANTRPHMARTGTYGSDQTDYVIGHTNNEPDQSLTGYPKTVAGVDIDTTADSAKVERLQPYVVVYMWKRTAIAT